MRLSVPSVPVSLMASVVPKHSDRGRRSLLRFDHLDLVMMLLEQPVAGKFLTDIGDELNTAAPLRELAGSEAA